VTVLVGEPHTPLMHRSPMVHAFPSLHGVPFALKASGQGSDDPVQYAARSHGPEGSRHFVVLARYVTLHCGVPLHALVAHGVLEQVMGVPPQLPAPLQTSL